MSPRAGGCPRRPRAPKSRNTIATAISMVFRLTADLSCDSSIAAPSIWTPIAAPATWREEARFLHEVVVQLLVLRHPVRVLLAGQRGLVEGALLDEFLPLRRLAHLLEQRHVEIDLVRRHAAGHEDAAQHQVFDVEAHLLAGRDVAPRHVLGDLFLVGHALRCRTRTAGERCRRATAPRPRSGCSPWSRRACRPAAWRPRRRPCTGCR